MPLPTAIGRSSIPTRHHRILLRLDALSMCALVAVAAALALLLPRIDPARTTTITIDNRTANELFIEVRGAEAHGWMPLVITPPNQSSEVRSVIDQGDEWTFRFRSQGREGGTLERSREQLIRDAWRVTVGSNVESTLRANGAPPSPPRD